MVDFFDDDLVFNVTLTSESFSGDSQSEIPTWTAWFSSAFLLLMSLIGLPLNGATVMIFWRRKKLRHLVNFVLLLDCLSHIVLCLICIPIHVVSVWMPSGAHEGTSSMILLILQQVVGNFANLCGLLLTLSIAILRYRRLCWKKKDKFSTTNAIKWSVTSGSVAIAFAVVQSGTSLVAHPPLAALTFYSIKLALILLSILAVFFCYIRVAQRVWSSGANQEKVMDASKLKKSRSVHMRATFHSCVQIVLVVATLSPYLYMETLDAFKDPSRNGNGQSVYLHGKYANSYATIDRLLSITINYTLLILGTPLAYIASCHRFREQFASILLAIGHSPDPYLNNNKFTQQSGSPGQNHQHQNFHPSHLLRHHHKYHHQSTGSQLHQQQESQSAESHSHICPGHKSRKPSIHHQNNNNFLHHPHNHNFTSHHSHSNLNSILHPSAKDSERISNGCSKGGAQDSNYSISANYNNNCSYEMNKSRTAISEDSIEYKNSNPNNFSTSEENEGEISRASLDRSIHQHHLMDMGMDGRCLRPTNLMPATPVSITSRNSCSSSSTASTSSSSFDHNCDISSNSNSTSKLSRGFQRSSGSSFSSHNTTTTTGTGTLTSGSDSPGPIATSICIPFNSAGSMMCQYQHHTTHLNGPAHSCIGENSCQSGLGFGHNV